MALASKLAYLPGRITLIPGGTLIVLSETTYSFSLEALILLTNDVTSILYKRKTIPPTILPRSTSTGSGRVQYNFAVQTLTLDLPVISVSGVAISLVALRNKAVIEWDTVSIPDGNHIII